MASLAPRRPATRWDRFADGATRILEYAAAIGTGTMLVIVLTHIVMRYFFNSPLPGMNTLVGNVAMPVVVFIGFVVSVARSQTIQADIIYDRFPLMVRRQVRLMTSWLSALICALFTWQTFLDAVHSTAIQRTAPASHIETWWVYWFAPFSFLCLTWLFALDGIRAIRGRFDRESSMDGVAELQTGGEFLEDDRRVVLGEDDPADVESGEAMPDAVPPGATEPEGTSPLRATGAAVGAWIWRIGIGVALAISTVLIFVLAEKLAVGFATIALMLVFMLLRMPVAFAMAIPGLLGVYALAGPMAMTTVLRGSSMASAAQWAMSVLPMFMLMGLALGNSGLTTTMYTTARNWLSWLPGGLAVGTNMAGMGLAAVSGSTIGTTYAIGRVGVPEMFRAGYSKWLAVGSVITSGLPGQLIPPSVSLVIMAGLLNIPVGPTLMAGVVPGIIVGILFSLNIVLFAMLFPSWGGRGKNVEKPTITWSERWRSLTRIWPVIALMIFVFGGMFGGVFTTSEAGAAGAFGALLLLVVFQWKNRPFRLVLLSTLETVSSVGAIFLMIVGSMMFASVIALSGIGALLADSVEEAGFTRVGFLFFMLVVYLVLGTFMDPIPIALTTIPLVYPLLGPLGIDPMWFAVFAVFMGEIAILSPPVGLLTFVIHRMVQEPAVGLGRRISVNDVFNAVWLFIPMSAVVVAVWIFFPEIVTWLPNLMQGRG